MDHPVHCIYCSNKTAVTECRNFQMRFFLGMEKGSHLEIPGAEYHEVQAFRLEPEISSSTKVKGHITVDGEVMTYEITMK